MLFLDSKAREWCVRLDLGLCLKLRNALRLDLLDPAKTGDVTALLIDRERLGNVLWALVTDQATAAGVAREEFYSALDSDALGAGWGALVEAFTDFCPRPNREAVREAIATQTEAMERAGRELAEMVKGPEAAGAIDRAIADAKAKMAESLKAVGV